jgi:hypothetical protein
MPNIMAWIIMNTIAAICNRVHIVYSSCNAERQPSTNGGCSAVGPKLQRKGVSSRLIAGGFPAVWCQFASINM